MPAVAAVYDALLQYEEAHGTTTGWQAGVYPTAVVAEGAAAPGDAVCIGRRRSRRRGDDTQPGTGAGVRRCLAWQYGALPEQVLVLHTLCIAPRVARRGYGRAMVQYAEDWAVRTGCAVVRLDTWMHNRPARSLYEALGYRLAGSSPAKLNGLIPLELVFYEKAVGRT